jgi:hypothetical protein
VFDALSRQAVVERKSNKEDMKLDLDAAQAAMRSKMKRLAGRLASKPKSPKTRLLTPARAVRIFLAQELKRARRLNRRKHKAHRWYLALKRSKKKLTQEVDAELRALLVSFREMNAAMRESRDALRGALNTYDRQSRQFQMGYALGLEHAELKQQTKTEGTNAKQ